jgi:hypothetical protein
MPYSMRASRTFGALSQMKQWYVIGRRQTEMPRDGSVSSLARAGRADAIRAVGAVVM